MQTLDVCLETIRPILEVVCVQLYDSLLSKCGLQLPVCAGLYVCDKWLSYCCRPAVQCQVAMVADDMGGRDAASLLASLATLQHTPR